ncbi:MAG: hypothetical protein ACYCX2_01900 [Christensenellales bacterium]
MDREVGMGLETRDHFSDLDERAVCTKRDIEVFMVQNPDAVVVFAQPNASVHPSGKQYRVVYKGGGYMACGFDRYPEEKTRVYVVEEA